MLKTIVFAPLVGAAILGLFGKRMGEKAIATIACSTILVSAVASVMAFMQLLKQPGGEHAGAHAGGQAVHQVPRLTETVLQWITAGNFSVDFSLMLDPLSGVMVLFVTGVGFLIHVFASGYMSGEDSYYRFFTYLNLFMFMMLTLVLADNYLVMFVGWEGVGLCSYLLIGYYFLRDYANDAAKKAFIVNRIGDFGFALAVMLIFYHFGNVNFIDKHGVVSALTQAATTKAVEPFGWSMLWAGGMTTVAILLFIGATGKSAQIPLYVWLPDAMAGPTPVSALIHAATMVTAGVYMIVRSNPIFIKAPTALTIVAIVGALTALFAATIGLSQWNIKKVLAYSTVSQLGYMVMACGVGAFAAGFFHVVTHAFFKALLFLGSGSVIHAMHHDEDMRNMGGLRKYLPITFFTMLMGTLAIAGFPLFSGFFSKDEILWKTESTPVLPGNLGTILYIIGLATAGITAIYMTRMMVLTFFGEERFRHKKDEHGHDAHGAHGHQAHAHDDHAAAGHGAGHGHGHDDHGHGHEPHESPLVMTLPLIVLAVLAVVGGFVGVPEGLLHKFHLPDSLHAFYRFLEPVIYEAPKTASNTTSTFASEEAKASAEFLSTILSVIVGLVGIGIGFGLFSKSPMLKMPAFLENKYYIDEIYDFLVVRPLKWLSNTVLWKGIDMLVIDGTVNGLAKLVELCGSGLRYLQPGFARLYAAFIFMGALIVIGYFFMAFFR